MKKKSQAVEKLSKKVKKKAGDAELCEEHEMKLRDLSLTGDMWVDRERAAVRDIQVHHYCLPVGAIFIFHIIYSIVGR